MPAPQLAAIALGSNLGDRTQNLHTALTHLATLGRVLAVSTFHATAPVGYLDQPDFLNAAALLETTLTPQPLLEALLTIEQTMGRIRTGIPAKGPRLIDLDLLLYLSETGQQVLTTPTLTLPHPALHERPFVLIPLAEVAPTWLHPILHQTIQSLLTQLRESSIESCLA